MSAAVLDSELVTDLPALGDAELVERFVIARDHQAFSELVHRHGPVVLGVCRRVLHEIHDVEDVFQATFLVFVRDAGNVRKRASLASWFYGVAYRLALRATRQRQRRRETTLLDDRLVDDNVFQRLTDRHVQQAVDDELNALSEKYRQPLALRYLCGKSPVEIANELKITVDALDGLLKRGKSELRTRLLKRGITLSTAVAAVHLAQQAAQASEATSLVEATVEAGLAWKLGSSTAPCDLIADWVVELAGKEGIAMAAAAKTTVTIGLAVGAVVAGFGASTLLSGRHGGHAEASGIVTTLPAMRSAYDGAAMALVSFDPVDNDDRPNSKSVTGNVENLAQAGSGNFSLDAKAGNAIEGFAADDAAKKVGRRQRTDSKWDYKSKNPNVEKVELALMNDTEVAFSDIPLKDALEFLKGIHNIEIWTDTKSLSDEGISHDNTVTLHASGLSMRSVLRALLEPLLLDYIIENEMLVITTTSRANATFETRVYNTKRLPNITPKELVEIITTSIEPDRWNSNAAAAAAAAPNSTKVEGAKAPPHGSAIATGNTVVIRQTQRIHEEIVELLNQLEQQVIESPDAPLAPAARENDKDQGTKKIQKDVDPLAGPQTT